MAVHPHSHDAQQYCGLFTTAEAFSPADRPRRLEDIVSLPPGRESTISRAGDTPVDVCENIWTLALCRMGKGYAHGSPQEM